MLEKPNIPDELIIGHAQDGYGLHIAQLTFLPIGADVNSAVYRVEDDDGRTRFLKLRRGAFNEMTVALPALLNDLGIHQIIAPLRTTGGQLWRRWEPEREPYTMTLYPFVQGRDAYEVEMSERQWIEFGAIFKRVHTAPLPDAIRHGLPRETFTPHFREQVRAYQAMARERTFDDPSAASLAAFMQERQAAIDALVENAERLARVLQSRPVEWTLCHADIHAGNLLLEADGTLHVVDWDTAILAPQERDLMYPGSGIGRGWQHARTEDWFYHGYSPGHGQAGVDPAGVAYYRCERMVQDVEAYCAQLLATTDGGEDRAQSLRFLTSSFDPGGIVDIALESCRVAGVPGVL
jgi:spectinomycin phosphotransferase